LAEGEKFEFPKLYTEFAKYYDRLEYQYRDYPKESEWIAALLEERRCKDVLDLSCGTGSHLLLLRERASKLNFAGMDASKQMVGLARKKLGRQLPLLLADFLHVPFRGNSFDAALCLYWSIAGLNESLVSDLFSEANSVLADGGLFILDTENAEGIKENLLNAPFIDGFFQDQDEGLFVIRANFSTKRKPDLVDWHSYYLLEKNGVSELTTDRMNLRFYSKDRLVALLEKAGFRTIEVLSGPGEKFVCNSPSIYFIAEKLADA
jgi:ubiquinone/menaquinone biosynthesis C-methylase UbiE